jgi:hypothetical protein
MTTPDDLEDLRRDVRYLKDRVAILDCVQRQARGHDRHDLELMASVYLEDGIDEHGSVVKRGPDYGAWANASHSAVFEDHLHNITTHTCEVDGDQAHCESYVIGAMRGRDGTSMTLLGGRYLDRLERRDGEWGIALRRCTLEWTMSGDGTLLHTGAFEGFVKGTWTRDDPSYARPMRLDDSVERWGDARSGS